MNLSFSEEDLKFQDEVRSFIAENYPADIKNKMDNGIPVSKDDIQTWQRILSKKVGLQLIGLKNMVELVGLLHKNIFSKMN